METDRPDQQYAFLVLVRDEDDAAGLARLLEDLVSASATAAATFAAPAVRGVAYLATDGATPWAADTAKGAQAILLIEHADDLAERLTRLRSPARMYIGVPPKASFEPYEQFPYARPFTSDGPLDFAVQVLMDFSQPNELGDGVIFDVDDAQRMRALTEDFPSNFGEEPQDEPAGEPGEAEFGSGWSAYAAGDYDKALKFFDDARQKGFADQAGLQVWRGACLYELARADDVDPAGSRRLYADALSAFNRARRQGYGDTPDRKGALDHWFASVLYGLERYSAAAVMFERRVTRDDIDVSAWFDLGSALALCDRYDEALAALDKVAGFDDRYPNLQRSRAALLSVMGRRDEAKHAADKAIRQDPDDAVAYYIRADTNCRLGRPSRAVADFREAERRGYPADGRVQIGLGGAYCVLGRYLEALAAYRAGRDQAEDGASETLSHAYEGIGYVMAQIGDDLPGARQACQESINLGDASPAAFATLAEVLSRLDLPYDALAAIEQAIQRGTGEGWPTAWRLRGLRAAVRFALADRDSDADEVKAVLDDIGQAKALWRTDGPLPALERRDRARLLLLEGEARLLLRDVGAARTAWREASRTAEAGTAELITADKYLRSLAGRPQPLPRRFAPVVSGAAVVLLGFFTWLLWDRRLTSAGFAGITAVLLLLPLAAYLIPSSARLKIGVLEVELLGRGDRWRPLPQPPMPRPPDWAPKLRRIAKKKIIPDQPRL